MIIISKIMKIIMMVFVILFHVARVRIGEDVARTPKKVGVSVIRP